MHICIKKRGRRRHPYLSFWIFPLLNCSHELSYTQVDEDKSISPDKESGEKVAQAKGLLGIFAAYNVAPEVGIVRQCELLSFPQVRCVKVHPKREGYTLVSSVVLTEEQGQSGDNRTENYHDDCDHYCDY